MKNYGTFDHDSREYVITNPKTPVKWINYIGTLNFGGFVDHTGGMLVCKGDPALNRITKYIPQMPASTFKGSTIYIRIQDEGGYRVYSPFLTPTLTPLDLFECHVGLGYSRFVAEYDGVRSDITIFVPPGANCVVQDITITNQSTAPKTLDVIPAVEYTHPDALKQFNNADWVPQTMQSKVVREENGRILLLQSPFMAKEFQVNFFTSNQPVTSFETDRRCFLGENEYGTWANPLSLQAPALGNNEALRGDNIAALHHALGEVAPGASRRIITLLGQTASLEKAQEQAVKYANPEAVAAALTDVADMWDGYLSSLQVDTPDEAMNHMLNVHNLRQCIITKNWSRYLSLYQLGLGVRGMGFRDSSQDVLGVLAAAPAEGKALITQLLHTQLRNGSALHQFNPLSMEANRGESGEDEAPDYYSDDHLWIILATAAYLKETADFDFLDTVIPFYEKNKTGQSLESGTVWEHLQRAIEFTRNDVGQHGLPLAGFADWNDTVNLPKGAESLYTANLYGKGLRELIELADYLGKTAVSTHLTTYYNEMKACVNETAWDGGWYVRYFNPDGTPIGSNSNEQGKIFTNAQSWSVLSGFAPPERAEQALDAVYTHLNTKHGIKLSTPGYNGFDPTKGGVTTYPPGAKENGGIFLHANPWVIIAETMLGNGARAYEYYAQINPAGKNDVIDEFECEPYAYPQNILGDEHPLFGLARNSWLTGTAAWTYQASTQHILGLQPTYAGLRIDPCIPPQWDGFSVTRRYRGTTYHITVKNPNHASQGVQIVKVGGELMNSNVLPLFEDYEMHEVEIILA